MVDICPDLVCAANENRVEFRFIALSPMPRHGLFIRRIAVNY